MPFGLVVYAFFIGHWSGMTPLQTFAVSIFTTVGTPINKYYATVIIGEHPRGFRGDAAAPYQGVVT